MNLLFIIGGVIVSVNVLFFSALVVYFLFERRPEQKSGENHLHDCLVEECDFHTDAEVDGRLRKWLADNKLRGAVVADQAIKEFMLNHIIAEVRAQRPIIGENDADRGTLP